MINVIVAGAAGRMGSRLVALIKESPTLTLSGAIEGKGHQALGQDAGEAAGAGKIGIRISDDLPALLDRGEVVIDFSAPEATLGHLRAVAERRRAMVIGTTGFNAAEFEELKSLTRKVPCVCSPNMSVGINLIYKVIGEMAKALGDDYDIEVIEAHHRLKKDAPSGTAGSIDKPNTGDAAEDAYIYGYRLWAAKKYPAAEAQLKSVVAKYPDSKRASYAQNLLGRSYLDDGKPSLASIAFYDNYKKMPDGERAPDSLYYLAQALMQLKKPADACKVYGELSDVYGDKITAGMKADIAQGRRTAQCK